MSDWRITFPIEKAEQREDGLYIIGLASGPEIDAQGERMDGSLIYAFADQINSTGGLALSNRLPYRDAHAPDGVLRDLGWLTKASVNDQQRLSVEVKLDEENPAAMYLFRALKRGKQYGMSVAGKVLDFADEFVSDLGKTIRTYKDVVLTEISNTTRPAWTPSFGSVLSKAISETQVSPEQPIDHATHADQESPDTEKVDGDSQQLTDDEASAKSAVKETTVMDELIETPSTTEEPAVETEQIDASAEKTETPDPADVEKDAAYGSSAAWTLGSVMNLLESDTTPDRSSLQDAARALLTFVNARIGSENGEEEPDDLTMSEKADEGTTTDETVVVETAADEPAANADSNGNGEDLGKAAEETPASEIAQLLASVQELVKSNSELAEKVTQLESRGTTQLPPIVERSAADADDFLKSLEALPREARLRAALAARTGGR